MVGPRHADAVHGECLSSESCGYMYRTMTTTISLAAYSVQIPRMSKIRKLMGRSSQKLHITIQQRLRPRCSVHFMAAPQRKYFWCLRTCMHQYF